MTKQITIAGVPFTLSAPYAAGQVMTDAEAAALNQVRAENIGNNCRKAIDDAKVAAEDGTKSVPESAMQLLLDLVHLKDTEYVFNMASARVAKAMMSPIEKEARVLAKAKLTEMLSDANKTAKEYGKEACENKIEEIAHLEAVVKLATKNVHNRAALAASL